MNSHGGNVPVIDIVTRQLRRRYSMLAIQASWRRLGYPDGAFSLKERAHGIHGGDDETSVMLAFQPQWTRKNEAQNFDSAAVAIESEFERLRVTQPIGLAWMASDLHELGAAGDASRATAEGGKTLAETGATRFIELLRDVVAFDLARLRPGPLTEK
jgi:creatinine amidohydrolase